MSVNCAMAYIGYCLTPNIPLDSGRHVQADYESYGEYHPWCCCNPDCSGDPEEHLVLPDGWTLDPHVTEHRPDIGVWWVILPDGTRTAWNGENNVLCHICQGGEGQADCSLCAGRGLLDNIPYCDRPWDEVVSGLWLGGHHCQMTGAPDGNCFPGDEFALVVSLHREEDPRFEPTGFAEHIRYRMRDSDLDPEHHDSLDRLAESVAHAVNDGCKVLVRCQAGINRAALVTGLAMLHLGWTADDAIQRMREVRSPYVLFNRSFVDYLREVEKRPVA